MFLLMNNTVSSLFLTDADVHFRMVSVRGFQYDNSNGKYEGYINLNCQVFSPEEQNNCDMFDSVL